MGANAQKSAILSDDRRYRYRLERRWGEGAPVVWIMLNPSTADETKDDLTITKCIGFAKRWNYNAIVVVNLYAYRATDPRELLTARDPIGPHNDQFLVDAINEAGLIAIAWGSFRTMRKRIMIDRIHSKQSKVHCIRRCADGSPGHPSRAAYTVAPVVYE